MPPPRTLTRRNSLAEISRADHAGLWLDRFVSELGDQGAAKKSVLDMAADIAVPRQYRAHFDVWKNALESEGALLATGYCVSSGIAAGVDPAKAAQDSPGRLLVGLGNESILETSITLHHTYGVPVIPGSALKGLASSFAVRRLADPLWCPGAAPDSGRAHRAVFGTQEQAGCVTFLDALYDPMGPPRPLVADILTVHHPGYYQEDQAPSAPADWDSPNPIPFVTATGRFLIALLGPPLWVDRAYDILRLALLEEGVGSKTTRGYGRMALVRSQSQSPPSSASGLAVQGEAPASGSYRSIETVRNLRASEVKSRIGSSVQYWQRLAAGSEKTALARAILDRVGEVNWKDAQTKPWYSELLASLRG